LWSSLVHTRVVLAGAGRDALVVVEALGAQVGGVAPRGGFEARIAVVTRSLAGMTMTSMCVFHETDREAVRQTSQFWLQLTVREGFCRSSPSDSERRMEIRNILERDDIHADGIGG
jgi:hypothetical protein